MTYVWATVLVLVNLLWLASVLLQLPGTWLMVLGTLLTAYLQPGMFGTGSLVAVVALALVGELLELISGMVGAKRAGATRWGTWGGLAGAIIGAVAGTFLVPVPLFGSLIGACMGAVLVAFALERTKGKRTFQESSSQRYELLDTLGWDDSGCYYRLAKEALSVWKGVSILFEDAWWVDGVFRTKAISVIDEFELYGTRDGARRTKAQLVDCPSYIVWGGTMFAEFRDRWTKGLGYAFNRSLKSSVSRQLYRFLDKWLYFRPTYRHEDLRVFACEKIGLSRKYDNSNLIRKLERGLHELEDGGFLKPKPVSERFPKMGWGRNGDCLERAASCRPAAKDEDLVTELSRRGVTDLAAELVRQYPREKIERAIENFDDRRANGEEIAPGFLVSDIRSKEGYSFRRGYFPKADRDVRQKATGERTVGDEKEREMRRRLVSDAAEAETRELQAFPSRLPDEASRAEFEQRAFEMYRFREQLERAGRQIELGGRGGENTRAIEAFEPHKEAALKWIFDSAFPHLL